MKNINRHKPDRMRKIRLQQETPQGESLFILNIAMRSLSLPHTRLDHSPAGKRSFALPANPSQLPPR
jgi:hypothetical protein